MAMYCVCSFIEFTNLFNLGYESFTKLKLSNVKLATVPIIIGSNIEHPLLSTLLFLGVSGHLSR